MILPATKNDQIVFDTRYQAEKKSIHNWENMNFSRPMYWLSMYKFVHLYSTIFGRDAISYWDIRQIDYGLWTTVDRCHIWRK